MVPLCHPSAHYRGLPSWRNWQRIRLPVRLDLIDMGSIPGLARSPGEGSGNPLQ